MSSTAYPQLVRGTAAWLYSVVNAQMAQINTELTAAITSAKGAPQFTMSMGDPLVVTAPTLAVLFGSTTRTRFAQHNYQFILNFRVCCLIPHAGDDTAMDHEMARQVAADNLLNLFTDESLTLTPKVVAGPLGTIRALYTDFSTLMDIFPRKLADGKTIVRGFELPISVGFDLTASS